MESISKSEKKEQKSTDTFETLNLADVFPSGKVKKQLLANKNVGKLRKDSVELIGEYTQTIKCKYITVSAGI